MVITAYTHTVEEWRGSLCIIQCLNKGKLCQKMVPACPSYIFLLCMYVCMVITAYTHTVEEWKSGGGLPSRPVLVVDHLLDLLVGLSVFLGDVLLTKC